MDLRIIIRHIDSKVLKNRIGLISLFFTLFLLFSCERKRSETVLPEIHLKGTILQPDSLLLGHKVVAVVDNHLVFPTWKSEYLYDVFQMKGDSLLFKDKLISRGQGPYELTVSEETYDAVSGRFVIYDCNIGKGFLIEADSIGKMTDYTRWKPLEKLHNEVYVSKMVIETDSTVITAFMKDGFETFLGRYNLNTGKHSMLYGLWPDDGFDGSDYVKQTVYANGSLLKCPDRNLFLVSSQKGQYAEIFRIEQNRIIPVSKLFDLYPRYKVADDGLNVRYARDNMRGLDICVTSDFIYVMFNKGTMEEYAQDIENSDSYNYKNDVFVYDWDGTLKRRFKLDYNILTLYVDNDDRFLYGKAIGEDADEEYIVRFELENGF